MYLYYSDRVRVRNLDQINLYGVKVFEINSIVLANKRFLLEMLNLSKKLCLNILGTKVLR